MFPRKHEIQRLPLLLLLAVFILFGSSSAARASSGQVDSSFNPSVENPINFTFGFPVSALAAQADGKILFGGHFFVVNGASRNNLARLNADGSLDASFNPAALPNGEVKALAVQPDGKILVGSIFTMMDNTNRPSVIRLNADGSLDSSFNSGASPRYLFRALALQPDGKVIVGGSLTGGVGSNYIARLNADGSPDTSFNIGAGGVDGYVYALSLQADGAILIGGYFAAVNNAPRNCLARLNADGSLDASFNPGATLNSAVTSIVIQAGGRIVTNGGSSGGGSYSLVRFNGDGSLDSSFNSIALTNGSPLSVIGQPDGKLFVGGLSGSINGAQPASIARLNADGSRDSSFNPGAGPDGSIQTALSQPDGKVIVGGGFSSVNGEPHIYLARLMLDGTAEASFNPRIAENGSASKVIAQPDGKILICGSFNGVNGTERSGLVRLNPDGSLDNSMAPNTGNGIDALALQPDGKILVSREVYINGGAGQGRVERLNPDGSPDSSFNTNTLASNSIEALALQADGKILIGGGFRSVNGLERGCIARLNADGSLDASFNPGAGADYEIKTMVAQADGRIIIGGRFTAFNNAPRNNLARLNADGSLDSSFNPAAGPNLYGGDVLQTAVQPDGKILLVGGFQIINGVARNFFARLNADGSLDASFNPLPGSFSATSGINALALQPDGKIIVSGSLSNGTLRESFLRRFHVDGSPDTLFNANAGEKANAAAIALQPDGKIVIGGSFISVNGFGHVGLARLFGSGASTGDFDGDGRTDLAVWNNANGDWSIQYSSTNVVHNYPSWGSGSLGDRPVPADYDGDGRADLAIYRPSEGNWHIILSRSGAVRLQNWGGGADVPAPADYDGDGRADFAVFRPTEGNWYILNSASGTVTLRGWGMSDDKLVPADYDGDGKADVAVFRPSQGVWYIVNSATGAATAKGWGAYGDQAVPADYDGDGRADIAVWRPSEGVWYILNSATGSVTLRGWGDATDRTVPGDYDGNGRADIAVWRPNGAAYYILHSAANSVRVQNLGDGSTAPLLYLPQ